MTKAKSGVAQKNQSHFFVKDIREKDDVRDHYLVKTKRLAETKKGDPYLSITLADRTGDVEARVWDKAEDFSSLFGEGDILSVEGRASSYRNQIQLILTNLSVYEGGADPSLFLETSPKDIPEMMGGLLEIIQGIKNPYIKALLESFFADHQFVSRFKRAPAAKNFHHNYLGGLLEHTLSVCQLMTSVAEHYHELDRDLLLAGAVLHDVGKVKELTCDTRIEYTDEGRLLGHLTLGVTMLEEKMTAVKNFPEELALRLKHLILSHHGQFEFGSPKRPKFLEAFALHLIDDLDAKINGLGRFMEHDPRQGAWTDFNRLFERFLLKGRIMEMEGKAGTVSPGQERQKGLFQSG